MRPGPESIPSGAKPGGVVIHVYDTAGVLVLVHAVAPHDDVAGIATDDADTVAALVGAADVVLVAFDGDTGARFTADDWSRAW